MSVSLGELAVRFGCELRGDPEARVERVATLANADARALTFLANPRYRAQLTDTRAGAVVLSPGGSADCSAALLLCDNPYATYARIATLLYPAPPPAPGVHPTAIVAAGARIDPSAEIGPYVVVGAGTTVGARARVGPHSSLERDVTLGADVRLVARVTLGRGVQIGERSVLQPGVTSQVACQLAVTWSASTWPVSPKSALVTV